MALKLSVTPVLLQAEALVLVLRGASGLLRESCPTAADELEAAAQAVQDTAKEGPHPLLVGKLLQLGHHDRILAGIALHRRCGPWTEDEDGPPSPEMRRHQPMDGLTLGPVAEVEVRAENGAEVWAWRVFSAPGQAAGHGRFVDWHQHGTRATRAEAMSVCDDVLRAHGWTCTVPGTALGSPTSAPRAAPAGDTES